MKRKRKGNITKVLSGMLAVLMLFGSMDLPVSAEQEAPADNTAEPTAESTEEPKKSAESTLPVEPTAPDENAEASVLPEHSSEPAKTVTPEVSLEPAPETPASAVTQTENPVDQEEDTVEETEVPAELPYETGLKVYEAEDAADMAAAVATLSDDDTSRLVVKTEDDLKDVISASGTAVYYDGSYVIKLDDSNAVDQAVNQVNDQVSDATVVKDEKMTICEDSSPEDKPVEVTNEIDQNNADQASEGLNLHQETDSSSEKKLVALIDTGVSGDLAVNKVNLTDDGDEDANGHGTRMAQAIMDASKGTAVILSIKAFNNDGTANLSNVYAAVKYAIEAKVDIINISASVRDSENTKALAEAITEAKESGITVVVSAGNAHADAKDYFPANMDGIITVGAANQDGTLVENSNYGDCVEFYVLAGSTSLAAAKFSGFKAADNLDMNPEIYYDLTPDTAGSQMLPVGDPSDLSKLYVNDDCWVEPGCKVTKERTGTYNGHYVTFFHADNASFLCADEHTAFKDGYYLITSTNVNPDDALLAAYAYQGGHFVDAQLAVWGVNREATLGAAYAWAAGMGGGSVEYTPNLVPSSAAYVPGQEVTFTDSNNKLDEYQYHVTNVSVSGGDDISSDSVDARVSGGKLHVTVKDTANEMPEYVTVHISSSKPSVAPSSNCTGGIAVSPGSQNLLYCGQLSVTPGETYNDAEVTLQLGVHGGYELYKIDRSRMNQPGQGDATLAGAEFTIYNRRNNKVATVITTDETGHTATKTSSSLKWGDYIVKETKAPRGYDPNTTWSDSFDLRDNGSTYNNASNKAVDTPWYGGIKVIKHDADFMDQNPQGDAALKGTVYSIYNVSNRSVFYGGKEVSNQGEHSITVSGKNYTYGTGNLIRTLTTDEKGEASTSGSELVYGTYLVIENAAPTGYKLAGTGLAQVVEVHQKETVIEACKLSDPVIRGGITVGKVDDERDQDASNSPDSADVPQGDGTLAGTEFTIYLKSKNHVMSYDSATPSNNKKEHGSDTAVMTITTTENGIATTDADSLPYGSYYIKETKQPKGYNINDEWRIDFEIREDGKILDYTDMDSRVEDTPIRGGIELTKFDKDRYATDHLGPNLEQGDAELRTAEFTIYNISNQDVLVDGKWVEPGKVSNRAEARTITDEHKLMVIKTDKTGHASTTADAFPYGTYLIKETKAPKGYKLNEEWYSIIEIREHGRIYDAVEDNKKKSDNELSGKMVDYVIRGGVKFQKSDAERNQALAQGDATLKDAEITIYNISKMDVYAAADQNNSSNHWVNAGKQIETTTDHYGTDLLHGIKDPRNFDGAEPVVTIKTNEQGVAGVGAKALPYGTYFAIETKPSRGYNLNTEWIVVFNIHEDGVILDFTDADPENVNYDADKQHQLKEQIIRGDVRIEKQDLELAELNGVKRESYINANGGYTGGEEDHQTGEVNPSQAIGGHNHNANHQANLNNITFTITNASTLSVLSDAGKLVEYQPGEKVVEIKTHYDDKLKKYVAETTGKALPYGTYTIQETKTNNAYLLTDGTPRTFEIEKDGEIVETDKLIHHKQQDGQAMIFRNQIKRGEFEFVKIAYRSTERMQTMWVLENATSHEKHILVTDPNGEYHSAEFTHNDDSDTNLNDALLDQISDNYETRIDLTTGLDDGSIAEYSALWFGLGEDGDMAKINPDLNSLPYGKYTLHEVRTDTNEGAELQNFSFYITRDQKLVHLGTVTDYLMSLSTKAADKDTGSHAGIPGTTSVILDKISYRGLEDAGEYTLKSYLVDADTGEMIKDADGKEVSSEKSVSLTKENGTIEAELNLNSANLAGKTTVVFEEFYSKDGTLVSSHRDLLDSQQTITFSGIDTTLANVTSGKKDAESGIVYLSDEVAYKGLTAGKKYSLTGTLMNKATGSALEGVKPVTIEFTPETADGTVEVPFEVATELLKDKTVVAFESCSQNGIEVAVHADINDKNQTVEFHEPEIHTTATDVEDGDHAVKPAEKVTITDRVEYHNLVPGKEYVLKGTLHIKNADGTDAGTYKNPDGTDYVVEKKFTPAQADDFINMEFTIDSRELESKSTVVFEDLQQDGKTIALHADISDEDQTVTVTPRKPEIHTTATGENGEKTINPVEKAVVIDTVSYTDLNPGPEYTLTGTLHLNDNGKDGGILAQTTMKFTPEASDGSVSMKFEFDASKLKGKKVVVFENLKQGDKDVAAHADPNDEGQSVKIDAPLTPTPTPTPGTTPTPEVTPTPTPSVPEIHTTAYNAENGYDFVYPESNVTIKDIVYYSGLEAGKQYEVRGVLHKKDSNGWDAGELLINGKPVTAGLTFTPKYSSGSVELNFTFDAGNLNGQTTVVFETLYRDNQEVCAHADISDEAQTVLISRSPRYRRRRVSWVNTGTGREVMLYGGIGTAAAAILAVLLAKKHKH